MSDNTLYSSQFFALTPSLPLDEKSRAAVYKKWDSANEEGEVDDLLEEAAAIASPKGYIRPVTIEKIEGDEVLIAGVRFQSPLLADKFAPLYAAGQSVYFFLSTCGTELQDWAQGVDDYLMRGVAEDICLQYFNMISRQVRSYAEEHYYPKKHFSTMNPGSIKTWDIHGQVPTFELLAEGAERCGITLCPSMLMTPFKSASGVYFETEHNFESCMFCDRLDCPTRRANFIMAADEDGSFPL